MSDICFFFNCTDNSPNLITCGARRIEIIDEYSVKRGNGILTQWSRMH